MPYLRERKDGCYIIKHRYRDNNTWQIDRDGYEFLKKLGIKVDDFFSTDIFMEMWNKKLIYCGPSRKDYWRNKAAKSALVAPTRKKAQKG